MTLSTKKQETISKKQEAIWFTDPMIIIIPLYVPVGG